MEKGGTRENALLYKNVIVPDIPRAVVKTEMLRAVASEAIRAAEDRTFCV